VQAGEGIGRCSSPHERGGLSIADQIIHHYGAEASNLEDQCVQADFEGDVTYDEPSCIPFRQRPSQRFDPSALSAQLRQATFG
jgi:hypothetical protein